MNQLPITIPTRREPLTCRWGFHKWTVWSDEKLVGVRTISRVAGVTSGTELRQERTCLKCNIIESRSSL